MRPHEQGTGAASRRPGRTFVVAAAGLGAAIALAGGGVAIYMINAAREKDGSGSAAVTPSRQAFLDRAGEAIRNSSWGEAEAVLREAVAIYDRDQEIRLQLADVLRSRASAASWHGESDDTVSTDVVRRRKDSAEAYEQILAALDIGPRTPEIEFRAGLLASEAEQRARAIEHFYAARAGNMRSGEYALYLAQAQLGDGRIVDAKVSLLAAVNLDPENAVAWGTLGEIYLRENKPSIAIENLRRAREIQPGVTLWRLVEARALKRMGQDEEALQLLIALPPQEQRDPPVLSLIAECYSLLGRPQEAAERYGAASDSRPTDAALAVEAARWFIRTGQEGRARRYAERAALLGSDDGQEVLASLNEPGAG